MMTRYLIPLSLLLFAATAVAAPSAPTKQYISDRLELPMRSGESVQHRILRMLPSGTPVQVLQSSKDTGYSEIRTQDGTEGWVLTRFLMQTPSARVRLAAAEQKVAKLELANADLKKQSAQLGAQAATQAKQLSQLQQDKQSLTAEVQRIRRVSGSALALDSENRQLKAQTLAQGRELQALRQENEVLKDRGKRDWFLAGAAVLFVGMLLGLILPRLRLHRRGSWDSF